MAWPNDSVPDGIGDDPPFNDDASRSRQGGTQLIILRQMGQSAFFFLHLLIAIYYLGL